MEKILLLHSSRSPSVFARSNERAELLQLSDDSMKRPPTATPTLHGFRLCSTASAHSTIFLHRRDDLPPSSSAAARRQLLTAPAAESCQHKSQQNPPPQASICCPLEILDRPPPPSISAIIKEQRAFDPDPLHQKVKVGKVPRRHEGASFAARRGTAARRW